MMQLAVIGKNLAQVVRGAGVTALAVVMMAGAAHAELVIDITQGNIQPLPVAITDFYSESEATSIVGQRIADVVRADLARSGLFEPIDRKAFLQKVTDIQTIPVFSNWRKIGAQGLSNGEVSSLPDGRIEVKFR